MRAFDDDKEDDSDADSSDDTDDNHGDDVKTTKVTFSVSRY